MSKTALGLDENVEGLLCYLLWPISSIIFLVLEKESDFVRFHAMQSIVISLSLIIAYTVLVIIVMVVGVIVGMIAILFPPVFALYGLISILINLAIIVVGLALWILGMYKAYQGERYKFPIFGGITEKLLKGSNI